MLGSTNQALTHLHVLLVAQYWDVMAMPISTICMEWSKGLEPARQGRGYRGGESIHESEKRQRS